MKWIPIVGILVLSFIQCSPQKQSQSKSWQLIYKHDRLGTPVLGHVDSLISAIRQGCPIRIGWGNQRNGRSIEHLSEPVWLAVVNDSLVSAHLDPQVLAQINFDSLTVTYRDSNLLHQEWRVAITTSGTFDAVWYDTRMNRISRRVPQRHPMTWFAQGYQSMAQVPPFYQ